MASTYTANNGIEKIGTGEQSGTWGDTTNINFDIVDRALNGVGALSLSGTTTTLTTSDGTASDGHYKVLVLGGSPSGTNTITISPNDQDKFYLVKNDSGEDAIFTQGTGGNATVADGSVAFVFADGAGAGAAVTKAGFATLSGTETLTNKTLSAPTITGDGVAVTQTAGDNSTKIATTAYADTAAGGGVPSGSVFHFAANSAPSGYLACDGSAVDRTTYADLFAVVGTTFGSGDGSTTFNLPDLVGQFVRGWNATGTGDDASRVFGSTQEDSITNHRHFIGKNVNHVLSNEGASATKADFYNYVQMTMFNDANSGCGGDYGGDTGSNTGGGCYSLGVADATAPLGDTTVETETRPKNVALLACIKT